MQRLLYYLLLALFLASCSSNTKEAEKKRPNILFIMSDDHAYQAVSASQKDILRNISKRLFQNLLPYLMITKIVREYFLEH